jgi:hypothetical protein
MSEIDRIIADVVPEREMAEVTTDRASPLKMNELEGASSEDIELDLRHLGGQELSEEDISELKEFALLAATSLVPCSLVVSIILELKVFLGEGDWYMRPLGLDEGSLHSNMLYPSLCFLLLLLID